MCVASLVRVSKYSLQCDLFSQAILLLNANVAFLVVPALALNNAPSRTAQAASQVSLATSLGSIVIGLLLARKHRDKDDSAQNAVSSKPIFADLYINLFYEICAIGKIPEQKDSPSSGTRDTLNIVQSSACSTALGVRNQCNPISWH